MSIEVGTLTQLLLLAGSGSVVLEVTRAQFLPVAPLGAATILMTAWVPIGSTSIVHVTLRRFLTQLPKPVVIVLTL